MAAVDTNELVAEVTQIPVHPGAAMRLLWMLEDPDTSEHDLGRLIETDPALSTQVIRHANTAFYGMSGQVASAARAVGVLGIATVRALATTAAFDLFSERGRAVPEGFWQHSVAAAAACSVLAGKIGVDPSDAFSAGLLHDIGTALVYRRAPRRYEDVLDRISRSDNLTRVSAELEEFGFSHPQVGAAALGVMKFPAELVDAVAHHHDDPTTVEGVMARLLIAADALALAAQHDGARAGSSTVCAAIEALDLPGDTADALVAQAREESANLSGVLTVRG